MTRIDTAVPRSGSIEHEGDDHAGDDADRQQRVADLVDAVHAPLEQRRDEEDDRDLRQLRRLDAERPEVSQRSRR